MKWLSASRGTFVAVAAVLVALSVVASLLLFGESLVVAYWQSVGGSRIRASVGFELQPVSYACGGRAAQIYSFSRIEPGSPCERAGLKSGDTLVRWVGFGSRPELLYKWLESARGTEVAIEVVQVSQIGDLPRSMRVVHVAVPQ
jgi:hypothetical protein